MGTAISSPGGSTWLALLRGVNVVGKNKVPMKALADALETAGFLSVRTYIQSGNILFRSRSRDSRALARQIEQLIARNFGCAPTVMVIDKAQLAAAVRGNPFPGAQRNHKCLHLYFLAGRPSSPDIGALARLDAGREAFKLAGRIFYLWTPDGFPDSVLRSRIERCLGVPATARNWRTVNELLKLLNEPIADSGPGAA